MAWIPSDSDMGSHPKTKRLARRLEISLPTAVGFLHLFWHWCVKFAPDGELTLAEVEDVADAVTWEKEPETFIGALCASGFTSQVKNDDGEVIGFSVHNWDKHGGRYDKRKKRNAEAQSAYRDRNKDGNTASSVVTKGSNDYVSITSSLHKPLEERRGEENREEGRRGECSRAGEPNFDDEFPYRPNIESPLALAVRNVCRKGIVLSIRDREKLERVLCGLEKENATVEQVEEFGRKCANYWIGRDSRTKQPRPPDITQVLEHWHAVLDLPEPTQETTLSEADLDALAAQYA